MQSRSHGFCCKLGSFWHLVKQLAHPIYIDLMMGVHKPHHHIHLTQETKLDVGICLEFLLYFNDMSFLADSFLSGDCLQLYTDAAGNIGYEALCGTPVLVPMVLLVIAHLYASGSAPASIVSTVSAVAYFHKINGFHDPSNCFMVSKLLAGARNLGTIPDVRLPVTLPVLSRLVHALHTVFTSWHKRLMLLLLYV